MISLELTEKCISDALHSFKSKDFLTSTIYQYLKAYGTKYPFVEFYTQKQDDNVTALILRYNSTVYCYCCNSSDTEEVISFLDRFRGCDIITNIDSSELKETTNDTLFEMKREGYSFIASNGVECKCNSDISGSLSLLREHLNTGHFEDFYLNMSLFHRRGLLDVYSVIIDNKPVSTLGLVKGQNEVNTISFLYTAQDFRGNNYAGKLLEHCLKENNCILLLCERHNLEFYIKNRFTQVSSLSYIKL